MHKCHVRGRVPQTDIADGINVGHIGLHVLARRDVTALIHVNAGTIQIQIARVGIAPHRKQHAFGLYLLSIRKCGVDAVVSDLQLFRTG